MVSLPGNDLIASGIRDLRDRRETLASLLVCIGAPKLRSLGIEIPDIPATLRSSPEHRLYDLLASENPNAAHSKYNSLIRKLVSFERAFLCVKK